MRYRSTTAKYKCWSVAVLRSEGSRVEGRGKRQEEGVDSKQYAVGRIKGKVCFGFLLLDDPCPLDFAQGKGFPQKHKKLQKLKKLEKLLNLVY
jgi:hypothetical protein